MEVIKRLMYAKKPSMTLAVEAADDTLRRNIGKVIDTDAVKDMVMEGADLNYRNFKFYFMTGLPPEDDHHIDRVGDLLDENLDECKTKEGFCT